MLLGLYAGTDDVVFGATRACRHSSVKGAESMVGLFINTLPVRVACKVHSPSRTGCATCAADGSRMREHEQTPLATVQGWSEVARGEPLFESIVVFEKLPLIERLRSAAPARPLSRLPPAGNHQLPARGLGIWRPSLHIELTYDRHRSRAGDRRRREPFAGDTRSNRRRSRSNALRTSIYSRRGRKSSSSSTGIPPPRPCRATHPSLACSRSRPHERRRPSPWSSATGTGPIKN